MSSSQLNKDIKIKFTNKGVCAPKGFKASGCHAGIKSDPNKKDMVLIFSEKLAKGVAVYTKNLVKGAPLIVTADHLKNGLCQGILCNSGNANTCTKDGVEIAHKSCVILAEALEIPPENIIVASRL